MKKLSIRFITLALAFILSACGSLNSSFSFNKSAGPRYKISDEDVKKWVLERNKVEQCLYPKQIRTKGIHTLSKGDQLLYQMAVSNKTLHQVVGSKNYLTLTTDPASQQYLAARFKKLNHSRATRVEKAWCDALKKDYDQLVKSANATAKRQNAEATKQAKRTAKKQAAAATKDTETRTDEDEFEYRDPLAPQANNSGSNTNEVSLKQRTATGSKGTAIPNKIKINFEPVKNEVYSY